MERERLTQLLGEPRRVAREDLVGLRELTARYPWFSGAHLLLAVGEHASGSVLFDERLRTAAANVPSRAVVFDLVQPADGPPPTRRATPPDAGPMRLPSVATERPVDFEDHPAEPIAFRNPSILRDAEAPPTEIAPPPAPELPNVEEPTQPSAEEPAAAPAEPSQPLTEEQQQAEEELDRQITEAVYAQVYDFTWKEEVPPPPIAQGPALTPPSSGPIPAAPAPPVVSASSRFRFSEWLDLSSETAPLNSPVTQASATMDWLRRPVGESDAPGTSVGGASALPLDANALIDRFIQGEAPPPAHKAEFYNPQQAGKRSLEDRADLVTETLARIYEDQGNLAKAAQAYRKLAARTPERSEEFLERAIALEARSGKG